MVKRTKKKKVVDHLGRNSSLYFVSSIFEGFEVINVTFEDSMGYKVLGLLANTLPQLFN